MFGGCGCDGCDCEECWSDEEDSDDDDGFYCEAIEQEEQDLRYGKLPPA